MFRSSLVALLCFLSVVNAHFRLLSPEPRGQFISENNTHFCGGYPEVTTNRTTFPLQTGAFTMRTGHVGFSVGVQISTVDNPNNPDNFTVNGEPQLVRQFVAEPGAGTYCIPLNITAANIPGVGEGSNVTIQVVVDSDDVIYYHCADLTLSSSAPSLLDSETCVNATATTTGAHGSPTATAPAGGHGDHNNSGSNNNNTGFGVKHEASIFFAGFATLLALIVTI